MNDPFDIYEAKSIGSPSYESPERRLAMAVLIRAVRDVRSEDVYEQEDASQWFLSATREHPYSFVCLCEGLGYNPDWVRKKVMG